MANIDLSYAISIIPIILSGLCTTLYISIVSLFFTLILSTLISLVRFFKIKVLNQLCGVYISFFRATPIVVQLFFVYFGFPQIIPSMKDISALTITIITLTLNTSSFMSENFRAAVESVDNGQYEACYSIGMNKLQTMTRIVLPQAIKVALPSIGNNFIMLIKAASLGFTIGIADILAKAKIEASMSFRYFEAYLCVIIIYWIVVIAFEQIQKLIEKKLTTIY